MIVDIDINHVAEVVFVSLTVKLHFLFPFYTLRKKSMYLQTILDESQVRHLMEWI